MTLPQSRRRIPLLLWVWRHLAIGSLFLALPLSLGAQALPRRDVVRSLRLIFTIEGDRATKVVLVQGGGRFEGPRK